MDLPDEKDMLSTTMDPDKQKLDNFFGGDLDENPGDDLLKRMEEFTEKYCQELGDLQTKFSERVIDTWDSRDDFLSLDVSPYENVNNPVFLIEDRTDNPIFNKVTTVFSALCQEMITLEHIAKKKFYHPLTIYGVISVDDRNNRFEDFVSTSNTAQQDGTSKNETIEIQMGRFLPFLQELCNFINRINAVVKNTVEQLAYLYHPKQKLYIATYKSVSMDYVLDRLSRTLTILVTFDQIVRENEEMRRAWENYKKMIGYMRTNAEAMGFNNDELNDFQHQIVNLEETIMTSRMYDSCIRQRFGVLSKVPAHFQRQYEIVIKQNQLKEDEERMNKSTIQQMKVVTTNRALFEEIDKYLKNMRRRIRLELKKSEIHHRHHIVDMFSLYGLSNRMFNYSAPQDKKFYKDVWSIQKEVPLVYLTGRAVWYLADFMKENIPYIGKTLDPDFKKIDESRRKYLQSLDDSFNRDVQTLYMRMCQWLIKWDAENKSKIQNIQMTLRTQTRLLIDGLILATQIQNLLTTTLWLHLDLGINFRKSNLRSLSICAELLKSIEDAFHRRSQRLSADVSYMLTLIQFSIRNIFQPQKQMLDSEPRLSSSKLDCLAALTLSCNLLNTAPTLSRIVVLNVASSVATMKNVMRDQDIDDIKYRLWKLDIVSSWQSYLKEITDCSFFYYALDFVPLILKDIFDNPDQAFRLPCVFAYLNDPITMLNSNKHEANPKHLFNVYKEDIIAFLDASIVSPLCASIENDLRIQVMDIMDQKHRQRKSFGLSSTAMGGIMTGSDLTHIHKSSMSLASPQVGMNSPRSPKEGRSSSMSITMNGTPTTPDDVGIDYTASLSSQNLRRQSLRSENTKLSKKSKLMELDEMKQLAKDYGRFLLLQPFRVLDQLIDIKKRVEFYIDKTFYNMATVALHAWEVYAEMRNLAKQKYNLNLVENHLPSQSHFSEGLDVLEIMRNIHIFVAKYNYNLNSQIFIERGFDQLHLNTINVQHVSNSIRTHGPGIMSTTVNFAYQFCVSKFLIFSEFLYDDHIKSRLMRDIRYFYEKKEEFHNRYPYEHAQKFNQFVRSLGQDERGQTYLDHFRNLITQIGNALGYVRMIRSGGLYYTSQAIQYVPDIDEIGMSALENNANNENKTEEEESRFSQLVNHAKLSQETIESAKNLDTVLTRLSSSFAEGVDYFSMICDAFEKMLSSADHSHLENFAAIMPGLTLNFVEAMLRKKDRLNRKASKLDEACFTDDGFALGCAFLLRVLNLYDKFDAYHWWDEVQIHLNKNRSDLSKEGSKYSSKRSKKDEDDDINDVDIETWNLSVKRCELLRTEWRLLVFSFQAARIFFTEDNDVDNNENKENKENQNQNENGAAPSAAPAPAPAPAPAAAPAPAPAPPPMDAMNDPFAGQEAIPPPPVPPPLH